MTKATPIHVSLSSQHLIEEPVPRYYLDDSQQGIPVHQPHIMRNGEVMEKGPHQLVSYSTYLSQHTDF